MSTSDKLKFSLYIVFSPLLIALYVVFGFTAWFMFYSPCAKKCLDKVENDEGNYDFCLLPLYLLFFAVGMMLTPIVLIPWLFYFTPKFLIKIKDKGAETGNGFCKELFLWWKGLEM